MVFVVAVIVVLIVSLFVLYKLNQIEKRLRSAEQELDRQNQIATRHGGRLARTRERRGWSELDPPTLVRIYGGAHETVAHRLAAQNEAELQVMGAANVQVQAAATILCHLYRYDVDGARTFIRNKTNRGSRPEIADYIDDLVGNGANRFLLKLAIRRGRFPRRFQLNELESLCLRPW